MNFKAFLIEDEHNARQILKQKLNQYYPDLEIVGQADNAIDAISGVRKTKPDLLFLDISLPSMSGFEVLNELNGIDYEVIFVTGFDQYALKAIKFNALGYVLKPIDNEELKKAVDSALGRIKSTKSNQAKDYLQDFLDNPISNSNKIGIPSQDSIEFVEVRDIIRLEGCQKYTKVHTLNTTILSSYNIGEFIPLLSSYSFFQVHRSHLVNLIHMKRYMKNGTIIMSDDSSVPVAKRKRNEFLEQVNKV